MNFFGHAAAARHVDDEPAFVLGAMAPDLLPLCGAVAGAETSPKVVAGEAHHRWVDERFHSSPAFTALQGWAARAMIHAGLSRGAARGAAHVGIELFLDGVLAGEPRAREVYRRSLAQAETTEAPFVWRDPGSERRWRSLVLRLRDGAIPDRYRDPGFVAERLMGALARRPRLALAGHEAPILRRFLPTLERRVRAEAEALAGASLWVSPPGVMAAGTIRS